MEETKVNIQKFACQNLIIYWTFRLIFYNLDWWNSIIVDSYRVDKVLYLLEITFQDYFSFKNLERGEIEFIFDTNSLRKDGSKILENLKQKAWDIEPEFLENLEAIQKIFGLTDAEKTFLTFVILAKFVYHFDSLLDFLGSITMSEFVEKVSIMLDLKKNELYEILSYDSVLFKVGIIDFYESGSSHIPNKFSVLPGLVDELFLPHKKPEEIFQNYLQKVQKTKFTKEDFSYIEKLNTLISYLKNVLKNRERGINILLYGPPGTGKTELAKVLAKEAEADLYEVAVTNKKGEPFEERERFSCYRLAQFLLKRKKNALLLFDEVDDILDANSRVVSSLTSGNDKKGDTINKAWINRVLEENEVPTIWITNSISEADPAYLRRFDILLNIDYLSRSARLRILKKYFKNLSVSKTWLEKIAEIKHLSPSVIAKAAKVTALSKSENPEDVAEFVINSSLKALGMKEVVKYENQDKLPFIEDVLNTDFNIKKLISALKRSQKGKLLFYGPPGTGKTELARKIAMYLDKELLLKRASDLISSYVGETEINIALMFEEAKKERAVLLLDEADTFLLSRKDAKYSWEVSMVNEILTQMEIFEGIFICATNFLEALDEAVMRRFDLKVKFDYLGEDQKVKLFASLFGEKEAKRFQKVLSKLLLTSGNFATAYRKCKLIDENLSPDPFVKALQEEAKFNILSGKRNLGFV
ncbi:MAG: AAA family ATPase [Thermodesulfobacterium sp.]|nr:AAA family ATPase [Thermodesulfobacterium sp.]